MALTDSFYKKLCPVDDTREPDARALEKFLMINDRISDQPWAFPVDDEQDACFWDYFLNNFRNALQFEVEGNNYDLKFITEHMAVGPGASQKAVNTDFVSKLFEGPVSYTSEYLIPLYRSALSETGLWADAERHRSSKFPFVKVNGGKLFFAKKNAEISRTCNTEANLEMLFQMSIGAFYCDRLLKYFGISLSTQPDRNRELARVGSVNGSFGTTDLISASDCVSWQLTLHAHEECFLKHVLKACRSDKTVLPDGSEVVLKMTSTMGNGFTFPLQTLIFASAVKSVYEMMGLRPTTKVKGIDPTYHPSETSFGVFGDDIVVHQSAYNTVNRMLTKLGFEVNDAKSFNTGSFRESCGRDYVGGLPVRGVYIRSLETPQQVYSAINRLLRWSSLHGIPLVRTINKLRSFVREYKVPPSESDDAGIKVPFKLTTPKVTNRYWYSYRYYRRMVRKAAIPEEPGANPEKGTSGISFANPYGIGVGYLGGYIRRPDFSLTDDNFLEYDFIEHKSVAQISFRDPIGAKARYRLSTAEIPYWDWPGAQAPYDQFLGWKDFDKEITGGVSPQLYDVWKTTVLATLGR
jgi:hypothetical protein